MADPPIEEEPQMKLSESLKRCFSSLGKQNGARRCLLSQDEFVGVVKHHFSFLLEEFGFVIVRSTYYSDHFGDWIVAMQSGSNSVTIMNERGGISVFIGTSSRLIKGPGQELDLELLVAYLTSGGDTLSSVRDLTCRQQIKRLAEALRHYYPAIQDSLQDDKLIMTLDGVKEWKRRLYPYLPG